MNELKSSWIYNFVVGFFTSIVIIFILKYLILGATFTLMFTSEPIYDTENIQDYIRYSQSANGAERQCSYLKSATRKFYFPLKSSGSYSKVDLVDKNIWIEKGGLSNSNGDWASRMVRQCIYNGEWSAYFTPSATAEGENYTEIVEIWTNPAAFRASKYYPL